MLESVEAKTYTRVDTGERRVGFVANDIQANLPENCGNVLGHTMWEEEQILTLSYSRLTPFLWQIARTQQQNIKELEARLAALEAKKTKKVKE